VFTRVLILSSDLHLGLPSGLSSSGFPTKPLYAFFSPTGAMCYMPPNVARQRLGELYPAATNTHAKIELLDALFSLRSALYHTYTQYVVKGKWVISSSQDSVVGIATGSSPGRVKNFLFSTSSGPALRSIQPSIQWVLGALFPGLERLGREADHLPPTSAAVKKIRIYTSTPPYTFMA
jgi:hypothetical protein